MVELLQEQNPSWNDERLYQEARRLVVAELQHIVFNEYLPLVLGPDIIKKFSLQLKTNGNYYGGYSPHINPAISNEFSTAAFRFGHSGLVDALIRTGKNITEHVALHRSLYIPSFVLNDGSTLGTVLYGAANQNSLLAKTYVTYELTDHLFESKQDSYGLDIVSIHIQRGRDHGIPSYTDMRTVCGLSNLTSFDEFANVSDSATAKKFASVYK